MKILWLSNKVLSNLDSGSTGTWLTALANVLHKTESIVLGNITNFKVPEIEHSNFDNIEQWVIPNKARKSNGLPTKKYEKLILKIIRDFDPDIIHVWGVELYWGYITRKLTSEFPVLIEIQGLHKEISPIYGGELSIMEKFKCIGIKEILKCDTIFNKSRKYLKWGIIEDLIISQHTFFSTHSEWAEAKVKKLNPSCVMFKNERMLRFEFYSSNEWTYTDQQIVYTSIGYQAPFKGIYTLLKAVVILKNMFPNIKINIAGSVQFRGIRRDGYMNFLKKYIKKMGLEENVNFIGPQNGREIVENLHKSSVCVFPSYLESYGLVLAESMVVGTPIVAAYNGGYSYLGRDNENVLFFTPGDEAMCAFQLHKILTNQKLSEKLSKNARIVGLTRNNPKTIIEKQVRIYREISEIFKSEKEHGI